nr:serine/arginine repetitive matrix protein 1-like [Aegilops tauschii subsp. strangulata]
MTREAGDGEPRPKRCAPGRDAPPRPSPDGSLREAELWEAMLRSKDPAAADGADWRSSRPQERSLETWRGRGWDRDRRTPPRRSRSPPRPGRSEASPPRRYNPPRCQAQSLPPPPPPAPTTTTEMAGGLFPRRRSGELSSSKVVWLPRSLGRSPSAATMATCFNCGVAGHCQVDCTEPPGCFL